MDDLVFKFRQDHETLLWNVQKSSGAHPTTYSGGTAFIPGVKRPGREVDLSSPSSAEVKNEWSSTYTPKYNFRGPKRENCGFIAWVSLLYFTRIKLEVCNLLSVVTTRKSGTVIGVTLWLQKWCVLWVAGKSSVFLLVYLNWTVSVGQSLQRRHKNVVTWKNELRNKTSSWTS
jgi:hypothetical protein